MRSKMSWGLIAILSTFACQVLAKHYGQELCVQPGFTCLKVRKGQTWEKLFPDDHERSIEMRINRMNGEIYPGLVIAIPNNLPNADIMDFAPFPRQTNTDNEKLVLVDPNTRAWGAYNTDGSLLRWGPISAGGDSCSGVEGSCHTKAGQFRVYSLGSSGCISHKYPVPNGGAPMPYCMFFNNGQALHGSPGGIVGYNASHGCVRMYVNDAEWLRYDFIEGPSANNNFRGTRVIVMSY